MSHVISLAGARGSATKITSVPSSDAKKGFASLIQRVVRTNKPVVITRNNQPTAVLLSVDEYERLVEAAPDPLASLRKEFDQLLAAMQTPKAKAGVDALFAATPAQLGATAVKAARQGSL
jgi:antitoxin Phd